MPDRIKGNSPGLLPVVRRVQQSGGAICPQTALDGERPLSIGHTLAALDVLRCDADEVDAGRVVRAAVGFGRRTALRDARCPAGDSDGPRKGAELLERSGLDRFPDAIHTIASRAVGPLPAMDSDCRDRFVASLDCVIDPTDPRDTRCHGPPRPALEWPVPCQRSMPRIRETVMTVSSSCVGTSAGGSPSHTTDGCGWSRAPAPGAPGAPSCWRCRPRRSDPELSVPRRDFGAGHEPSATVSP